MGMGCGDKVFDRRTYLVHSKEVLVAYQLSKLPGAPPGAYSCWSLEYSSADKECRECEFQNSCRENYIRRSGVAPAYQPPQGGYMVPPPPPPPAGTYQSQYQPQTYRPVQVQPIQTPTQAPVQQQYGNPYQYQVPIYPYVQQPPIEAVLGQYQGESTLTRLGKNGFVRAVEAFLSEIVRFFHFWTWPPSAKN
jgi:hypothetical protein